MQPPSKTTIWANGERPLDSADTATVAQTPTGDAAVREDESDDEYQVISKRPKADVSLQQSSKELVEDDEPWEGFAEDDEPNEHAQEDVEMVEAGPVEAGTATSAPVSDADWLRSHTNRVLELVKDDEDNTPSRTQDKSPQESKDDRAEVVEDVDMTVPEEPPDAEPEQESANQTAEEEKVRQSGRLYLRNLHWEITDDDLRDHFTQYGPLEEVRGSHVSFSATIPMMNNQIGTTDALHMRSTGRVF